MMDILSHLKGPGKILSIPVNFSHNFAPAEICLYEWQDYWLELPGIDYLFVGGQFQKPHIEGTHIFRLRFENQLGLTEIQPFCDSRPLCPPLALEVISGKFSSPERHLAFFQSLLSDLFLRAANLPFTISAPTMQNAVEAFRPPTPLFILHFLHQFAKPLREAIEVVLANPHRLLSDRVEKIPVFEANEVDGDVILDILTDTREWVTAHGFHLAELLGGFTPERVSQRLPEETLDTSENRFIRHFLRQVLTAADTLPGQSWWQNVAVDRRQVVKEAANNIRHALQHPVFDDVGELFRLPFESRVLLQREGYREMLDLWLHFQQARRPLFEPHQHAIELRNVAFLYEMWVFFRLAGEIGLILGEPPVLDIKGTDALGLNWQSEARFGSKGKLIYNKFFSRRFQAFHSYSVALRPDFIWIEGEQPEVVFDAKFRFTIEWEDLDKLEQPDNDRAWQPQLIAVQEDIYKMHTYRDALGVRAAIIIFPGDQTIFYDLKSGVSRNIDLREIIVGNGSGVGAIPFCPKNGISF